MCLVLIFLNIIVEKTYFEPRLPPLFSENSSDLPQPSFPKRIQLVFLQLKFDDPHDRKTFPTFGYCQFVWFWYLVSEIRSNTMDAAECLTNYSSQSQLDAHCFNTYEKKICQCQIMLKLVGKSWEEKHFFYISKLWAHCKRSLEMTLYKCVSPYLDTCSVLWNDTVPSPWMLNSPQFAFHPLIVILKQMKISVTQISTI